MFIALFFICKTTLLPLRTTFSYINCTLYSRNFSKGEEILFIEHMRTCLIVTEINVEPIKLVLYM